MNAKCIICGRPVPAGRRIYCCDACAQEGVRRNARRDTSKRPKCGVYHDAVCIDCGKPFYGHIKSKRCPECAAVARSRASREYQQRVKAGAVRKLGSTDICQRCGKPYIVEGGLQRYCRVCAPVAVKENIITARTAYSKEHYTSEDRARMRKHETNIRRVCPVCSREFDSGKSYAMYCSPECRHAGKLESWRKYQSKPASVERRKARYKALTRADKDAINANARINYRKRKENDK